MNPIARFWLAVVVRKTRIGENLNGRAILGMLMYNQGDAVVIANIG
jgi:hypothetical protein